ncbi:MAG: DNA repair protein RecO, partial [Halanaerobiales bacterium]
MSIFKTETIVLKQFDLGEADKIISFYTKEKGKVRAVARGVRKSKSSISGLVLPCSYNYITFYRGRSLDRINQIKNIYSFAKLRENLTYMAYATFMSELVEKVGMEDHPNQALFSLLLSSFHNLLNVDEKDLGYLELLFKIRLLSILGFKPELDNCVLNNSEITVQDINYFSIEQGGIVSQKFRSRLDNKPKIISGQSLQILRKFYKNNLET